MINSQVHINSQPSRIALFLPDLRMGGAEHMLSIIGAGFASRGYTTDFVLVKAKGEYLSTLPDTIKVFNLKSLSTYTCLPALMAYLRKNKPDVMISALDLTNLFALFARRLTGYPHRLIIRLDNTQSKLGRSFFKKKLERLLLRLFYPWSDAIVSVSNDVKDDFIQYTGIPADKVHVIYNPIVNKEIVLKASQSLEHNWFSPNQPPVILGVGRLSPQKNFELLIKSFAKVRLLQPVRLIILGEGPLRTKLESLVEELNIKENIWLPGLHPNPFYFMSHASLFVLSSDYEGLPTVLVEALACGCPVISTDCPSGPREILGGGRYGKLVPVGDVNALKEAIIQVLSDDRPFVDPVWLEQFGEERVVEQYLELMGLPKIFSPQQK